MKTSLYIYCILCIWDTLPGISGMQVGMGMGLENDEVIETLNCSDSTRPPKPPMRAMLFDDEPLCCGNATFQRGIGSADLKYFQSCNVEPKNVTMSLEDSYWTFYDCIIKKSLGSVELTQKSYAQLIAKNLPDPKRSAIMNLVNNSASSTLKPTTGNQQLTPIKKFWEVYFEAEYKVCAAKNSLKKLWEPVFTCMNGKLPKIWYLPTNLVEISKCSKSMMDKNPDIKNSSFPIGNFIKIACAFIQSGILKEDDLSNADFNFETLYTKSLPKFYSKSMKEKLLQMFLEHTRIKYFNNLATGTSAGFQEIVKEMRKNGEGMLGNLVSAAKKNMYLNVITIVEIVHEVMDAILHTCVGVRDDMDPIM